MIAFSNLLSNRFILKCVFVFLTILMGVITQMFFIDDYLAHPQFGHFKNLEYCWNEIVKEGKTKWFYVFFIVDYVWALILNYLLFVYVSKYFIWQKTFRQSVFSFFHKPLFYQVFFSFTYLFDFLENSLYVLAIGLLDNWSCIVILKTILYFIGILMAIYVWYKKNVSPIKHKKNLCPILLVKCHFFNDFYFDFDTNGTRSCNHYCPFG